MKIKKGFKLLSIFLAICTITVYLSNNIIIAFADQLQETDPIEEEYLCGEPEESEAEPNNGIIGEMIEIPADEGSTLDMMSSDLANIQFPDDGTDYVVLNGVYAFENFGNRGLWLDVQQDKCLPGYHMQQYAANGNPTETFDRSCLFKITRRESTDSYIIRSMLNNRLTFYFSGNEVLTKEIPPNDDDVSVYDTFKLEYNSLRGCFVIKQYSSSNVVAAQNTTASGMAGAPDSYLIKSTETDSTNQARWIMYQYTGETKSGVKPVFTPTTTSAALIQNNTYSVEIITWTTEIGKNTPYALVHPDSQGMATGTWNASTYTLTLTAEKAGPFKLRMIIRSDGTTTSFRTFYGNYPIIPDISGGTGFVGNVATGKYMDVEGPSIIEGAFIQQLEFNGSSQTKWIFHLQSGGYFAIKSQYSNLYIGVDPTNTEYIRQYDSIESNTLWRLIETSSGNYKLVCKSLESSGYALATQSQTSGDGSNLMMTPYIDDANYRDEWVINCYNGTLKINIIFDAAYSLRYSDYATKISNSMSEIRLKFLEYYGVLIDYSEISSFVSWGDYCDQLCGGTYNTSCPHGTDADCDNSQGFNNANKELHHKNFYNIMYRITPPNINNNVLLVFVGHKYCRDNAQGNHNFGGINGMAHRSSGFCMITNVGSELSERKTIMHELGHLFAANLDHYGGNGPTTQDKGQGYSSLCIYGEDRENADVLNNLIVCDGCKAAIIAKSNKFNH